MFRRNGVLRRLFGGLCGIVDLHKDFQGLGLGNIMIENSIKIAIALGYKKITLQTNSLLYKAISLYEKYGFEEFKEEVFEKCDLAMVRKIA